LSTQHKPTLRTLSILELVSSSDDKYTLSEISRRLGISTSTLFPILHTLRQQRYLGFDEKVQNYSLGIRLFEIGNRVQESYGHQQIIEVMNGIQAACGETCHFGTLDRGDVVYLAKVDATQPVRLYSMIGKRLPAYGTAIGKALLKNYSMEDLKQLYPEGLKPLTMHTITDFEELYKQLNTGDIFLYESEESTVGVSCVAVPIYHKGAVVAACSVAVPVFRYDAEKVARIEAALKEALIRFDQVIHGTMF